jgi:hypothetical protein
VPELGDLQLDLPGPRVQLTLVVAGPLARPGLGVLVPTGVAQLVGFGVQQAVERLLDRRADDLAKMALHLRLINLDHVIQVLLCRGRCTVLHHSVLSLVQRFGS